MNFSEHSQTFSNRSAPVRAVSRKIKKWYVSLCIGLSYGSRQGLFLSPNKMKRAVETAPHKKGEFWSLVNSTNKVLKKALAAVEDSLKGDVSQAEGFQIDKSLFTVEALQ